MNLVSVIVEILGYSIALTLLLLVTVVLMAKALDTIARKVSGMKYTVDIVHFFKHGRCYNCDVRIGAECKKREKVEYSYYAYDGVEDIFHRA